MRGTIPFFVLLILSPLLSNHRPGFLFGGGGTRLTTPSLASVVHTFEAVVGSWGSVSAPESWVEPHSEIKIAKKLDEMIYFLWEDFCKCCQPQIHWYDIHKLVKKTWVHGLNKSSYRVDYADPSVVQTKHRVGDEMPHYLLLFFVKNKVQ